MGGAALEPAHRAWLELQFQSQGRFFGGCCIAQANQIGVVACFNRRGDSLGGAADPQVALNHLESFQVSIAGAILWGVLRDSIAKTQAAFCQFQSQGRFFGGCCMTETAVSRPGNQFQSQGRFFGGCCQFREVRLVLVMQFQSQGRFFGGCCEPKLLNVPQDQGFNRRGDSLGGAASTRRTGAIWPCKFQSQGRFFGGCCRHDQ